MDVDGIAWHGMQWIGLSWRGMRWHAGLFLHSPFPASDVFRSIAMREELLRAMLNTGASTACLPMSRMHSGFGAACVRNGVRVAKRTVRMQVSPRASVIARDTARLNVPRQCHVLALCRCIVCRLSGTCRPVRTPIASAARADLIGFLLFEYTRNFLTSCKRMLGLEYEFKRGGFLGVEYGGRHVMVQVSTFGVSPVRARAPADYEGDACRLHATLACDADA